MRLHSAHLLALMLIAVMAFTKAQVVRKDFAPALPDERDKRAVDFGQFVRNLLLKSAAASNVKADLTRNVLNTKTTAAPRRRTTTTTSTTTVAPFFFNKGPLGPFKFPFDLSGPINNKFNNKGGFVNFDYNDYGGQPPVRPGRRRRPTATTSTTTTTTTTTSTTARAPATPARRRPVPRRPYGLLGKHKVPYYDYYDDYDYNYDDAEASTAAAAPAATPSPAPSPIPRPQRPPTANRARQQGGVPQLRNRLVYQYRQPDDISINKAAPPVPTANNNNNNNAPDDGEAEEAPANNSNNSNTDETSANTNDYTDDVYDDDDGDVNEGPDNNTNNNPSNAAPNNNDSSNNANSNDETNSNDDNANNAVPPPIAPGNFNFNNNLPPYQGQFAAPGYFNGPPGFGNFGPAAGFPYPAFNDYNLQYQPSSLVGYSVRHY